MTEFNNFIRSATGTAVLSDDDAISGGPTKSKPIPIFSSGDNTAGGISTYVSTCDSERVIARKAEVAKRPNYSARFAIKENLEKAIMLAETLVEEVGNPIEKSILGKDLLDVLSSLWALRNDRKNEDWGDLINILQIVLKQTDFENYSMKQVTAIRKVIKNTLVIHPLMQADFEIALQNLSDAGFDPWKGISQSI